jgi:hypothetical protein
MQKLAGFVLAASAAGMLGAGGQALASSHREAPFITKNPKVDGTDFYMFRSYEPGRQDFVTLIANYLPLQDAYGGPNYFTLDDQALYEIHIDNNGDAKEDITFQFRFKTNYKDIQLPIGPSGNQRMVSLPVVNPFSVTGTDSSQLNVAETFTLKVVRGNRRTGTAQDVTNAAGGATTFNKPFDYIGQKTFPSYEAYAAAHVYGINIPGCTTSGKVFVGQRKEPFAVALGPIFDRVNVTAAIATGATEQGTNILGDKNVTSLILEVPIACLKASSDVIGGWTTASVRQARVVNPTATFAVPAREGGAWTQVSRLGMPLVNEVVIGIKDKDRFNSSRPENDAQFLDYVTHPILPAYLELLFGAAGVVAPTVYPRDDLVAAFLTGVEGVNKTATPSEMVRLNTAIPATPRASQNRFGAAGCFVDGGAGPIRMLKVADNPACDPAGFPNGRRPGDDVVDVELRVAIGYLFNSNSLAAARNVPLTDGAENNAMQFDNAFPYLTTPNPGAVNPE